MSKAKPLSLHPSEYFQRETIWPLYILKYNVHLKNDEIFEYGKN